MPFSVLLGGLAAVPAGWMLRDTSARFGWALLIAGPLAAFMFAPSLFKDRAVVDDAGFSLRIGIWGLTAVHAVSFEDLERVSVVYEESRGRRGRKTIKCYLLCELDEGGSAKIPINNDVSKAAAPHFLKAAEARGIPVLDAS